MKHQVVTGDLFEAEKVYWTGNGPIKFTRKALQKAVEQFNARQSPNDEMKMSLALEGDKLTCRIEGELGIETQKEMRGE